MFLLMSFILNKQSKRREWRR